MFQTIKTSYLIGPPLTIILTITSSRTNLPANSQKSKNLFLMLPMIPMINFKSMKREKSPKYQSLRYMRLKSFKKCQLKEKVAYSAGKIAT